MKKLIQSLINKFPLLKRNRIYYQLQRFRQYRPCKVDYSLTEQHNVLDVLVKDGIIVMNDYLPKETCETIIKELQSTSSQILAGNYTGNYSKGQLHRKAFRIADVDQISDTAQEYFFNDSMIEEIAKAYVSKDTFSYRKEADYKLEAGHLLQADLPHFDDWRHRFKAFLYLTDVEEGNAPFVYYKGSHEQHKWKYKYHLEYEMNGETGRYGHFFLQEMKSIQEKRKYEELVCTGKAGTLILADFRGIHKGTTLKDGQRVLLNNTFGIALKGF